MPNWKNKTQCNQSWLKIISLLRVSVAVYGPVAVSVWQYWAKKIFHFGHLGWIKFRLMSVFLQINFESIGNIWGSYRTTAGIIYPVVLRIYREYLGVLQDRCRNHISSGPSQGRHMHSESSVSKVPSSSAHIHRAQDTQQTYLNCQSCVQPEKIALKSTEILWAIWLKGFCW